MLKILFYSSLDNMYKIKNIVIVGSANLSLNQIIILMVKLL